nr:MAG TPA: hypothetical protein [Caudoviricetes sp.]
MVPFFMTMFIFFTRTTPTWTILTNHLNPSFYIFVRHNLLYTKTRKKASD